MNAIEKILNPIQLPTMAGIHQEFPGRAVGSPEEELMKQLRVQWMEGQLHEGMSVAVTVGSRGIANLVPLLRTLSAFLQSHGAEPYIVPSMGSHGGASPEGQLAVLKGLGITPDTVNMPIHACVEGCRVDTLPDGTPVMADQEAVAADAVILFNRIKAHTAFHGPYESGLMKMAAVGLGNCYGADYVHGNGDGSIGQRMEQLARAVLGKLPTLCGIGVMENAREETAAIHVLPKAEIPIREPHLLRQAREMMPALYLKDIDVLVIDRIGKDISGGGMDPNVVGGFKDGDGGLTPRPRLITVLDLTEATEGAAFGLGMADTTTVSVMKKYNPLATYPNCLMTGTPHLIKIPMALADHRQAIQAAVQMLPSGRRQSPRIVRIQDTLHLQEIHISSNMLDEALSDGRITVSEPLAGWPFNTDGNLF